MMNRLEKQLEAAYVMCNKTIARVRFPMPDRMEITFTDKTHTIISVDAVSTLDELYALDIVNFNIKE